MFTGFLIKYGMQLAIVASVLFGIGSLGYAGYAYILDKGYKKANAECALRIKEYESAILSRIDTIEQNSSTLIKRNEEMREVARKDFHAIIRATKGRPVYTIEGGKCTPSLDFVKAYNEAILRANQK